MNKREYKYFKFKKAEKLLSSDYGIVKLKSMGIYPIITSIGAAYFIDKKGNIVGTKLKEML